MNNKLQTTQNYTAEYLILRQIQARLKIDGGYCATL